MYTFIPGGQDSRCDGHMQQQLSSSAKPGPARACHRSDSESPRAVHATVGVTPGARARRPPDDHSAELASAHARHASDSELEPARSELQQPGDSEASGCSDIMALADSDRKRPGPDQHTELLPWPVTGPDGLNVICIQVRVTDIVEFASDVPGLSLCGPGPPAGRTPAGSAAHWQAD
jgi:hypothetical protein